jgi:hypothetical protein
MPWVGWLCNPEGFACIHAADSMRAARKAIDHLIIKLNGGAYDIELSLTETSKANAIYDFSDDDDYCIGAAIIKMRNAEYDDTEYDDIDYCSNDTMFQMSPS